jgi:GntR family transcriptional repressor for pyruvate dehydrogenase complex
LKPHRLKIPTLQPIRPTSVSDGIVAQVRAALFRGELAPGDFLGSETDLAQQLGVSRVPVRDAFRSLQAMGIIEVRVGAGGGARIAQGNPKRFAEALSVQFKLVGISAAELFDSQFAIETAATELAARNATAADLADLQGVLEKLRDCLNDPKAFAPQAFTWHGLDFHRRIVEASHNRALIAHEHALIEVLYESYAPQTTRALAERVLAKHARVFALIKDRDADGARRAMAEHLRQVRKSVLALLGEDAAAPRAERPAAKPRRSAR